jgi:hypothetical protein
LLPLLGAHHILHVSRIRVNAQNIRNWEIKITRSLLLISDGATISGAVSTLLPKYLSESSLPVRTQIYKILFEENFMEQNIF